MVVLGADRHFGAHAPRFLNIKPQRGEGAPVEGIEHDHEKHARESTLGGAVEKRISCVT